jgi:hypothetical protein
MKTFAIAVTLVILLGVSLALSAATVQSIQRERRRSGLRKIWPHFGLSIAFCALFFVTWVGQGISEWQTYSSQQRAHNEPVQLSGYIMEFGQSTLENWQSEFLQLFSFVVFSAVLIHRGSAESKDSDDRMEEALQRIEKKLDELEARPSAQARTSR